MRDFFIPVVEENQPMTFQIGIVTTHGVPFGKRPQDDCGTCFQVLNPSYERRSENRPQNAA